MSVEYRADAVVLMRDPDETIVGAVIVEVQLQADPAKRWSWPQYVTALRARLECPVVLLVIAPESSVARWARDSIETGHPGFALGPIVIEMAEVPRLDDVGAARQRPELAVLSVLAHPELENACIALDAISNLPVDRAGLYFDLILGALPIELRNRIGANVLKNYEYQSEIMRGMMAEARAQVRTELLREGRDEGLREGRDEGLREGRDEGLREGRDEGLRQGKCEGLRNALLQVARSRNVALRPELEASIAKLANVETLEQLIDSVLRAPNEAAAVAAIEKLVL
ncbi:MAG: hypothetical protein ABJE66_39670 [Deltaproteobacteria bacterium]